MKTHNWLRLAAVAALAAASGSALAVPSGFVTVDGTGKRFELYGQPFRYVGTNCYYLFDYGTGTTYDDGGNLVGNSKQYVREVLNEAQAQGIKVVRTWAFAAGDTSQALGGKYNLFEKGSPGNFQETTFKGLDYAVAEARKRGMRVVLALANNWDDYGGMKWYVKHSTTANQTLTGDAYHDQFYTDPDCKTFYKNFVQNLLNRTNTVTGRKYKDDPAVFAWELTNEARSRSAGETALNNWVAEMSAYIKTVDPDHMVTTGIEGWGSPWEGTNFIRSQADPNVDFATLHFYPDHWDWFATSSGQPAGIDQNKVDWWSDDTGITWLDGAAYDPALGVGGYDNWPKQHADWAETLLDKPVILEEIGFKKSHAAALADDFFQQSIDSFFANGGDGINLWGHAHDAYAALVPTMDDGFLYYVSADPALSVPSQPALDAIQYAMDNWENTPAHDPALAFIPEPGGLALALLALGVVVRRRRR